jgi:hypothetical protein
MATLRIFVRHVLVATGDTTDRQLGLRLERHDHKIADAHTVTQCPELSGEVPPCAIRLLGQAFDNHPQDVIPRDGSRQVRNITEATTGAAVVQCPLLPLAHATRPRDPRFHPRTPSGPTCLESNRWSITCTEDRAPWI